MSTGAAVLPRLGSPDIPAGKRGHLQVCSGCKRQLGFNTSRYHLQPKALSLPCNPGCWKHIWIVHNTGKGFSLVHEFWRGSLDRKQHFRRCHSVLEMGWCYVCTVTPVRSLLHALAPEVEQGFWQQLWKGWEGGGEHGVRFSLQPCQFQARGK